ALPLQGDAQVMEGLGKVGLEAEGLLIARHRLVEPALLPEGMTQVELDVGEVGLEPQRLLEVRHRLAQPPRPRQGDPQVSVPLGLVRPEPEGLVRIGANSLTVGLLRPVRVSGLMIPLADRWRFSKVRHGFPSYHFCISERVEEGSSPSPGGSRTLPSRTHFEGRGKARSW